MKANPKISVVMPTLNEERSIAKVVGEIKKYAGQFDLEILIVDSSTDKTPEIAESLGVRVIRQPKQGPGKALILGLLESKGDAVITSDCDGTYPMEDIPKFVEIWQQGFDFVNGTRINHEYKQAMPLPNWYGNKVFAFLVAKAFDIETSDVTSGMRLFSRQLIDACRWETNYSFWIEIIIKAKKNGFKFTEVPILYRERIGAPTINLTRSARCFLLCIAKYRFNLGFINPAHL